MKKLSDNDIKKMGQGDFVPDSAAIRRTVRAQLKLSTLIPDTKFPSYGGVAPQAPGRVFELRKPTPPASQAPLHRRGICTEPAIILDWHGKTEKQAWDEINAALDSGARRLQVITGASGILKEKFVQWCQQSTIAPHIASYKLVNRGCYEVELRRRAE
ncbi:MAG: hypothetical protein LBJ18_00885 [Rickettsiales bacterium]|jgi:hypothetical protein|nr:hypothetical protein [Rickettsiales bacterium]